VDSGIDPAEEIPISLSQSQTDEIEKMEKEPETPKSEYDVDLSISSIPIIVQECSTESVSSGFNS